MKRFILTPEANEDLKQIQDYIARDNPNAAAQLIDRCFEAFGKIADYPLIGHTRCDLTERDVRFWNVSSYLVVYEPESKPTTIVRVLSGFRDITSTL